jgi:hypothetical protein
VSPGGRVWYKGMAVFTDEKGITSIEGLFSDNNRKTGRH